MLAEIKRRRFTSDEFLCMGEVGILGPEERVELIDGDIIQMSPIGHRHRACVMRGTELFVLALAGRAIVSPQSSVNLNKYSEPQPDMALFKPRSDYYKTSRVTAENTFLVVEVSDTTLAYDTNVKVPLYARAGVPEVWIEDVNASRLIVYRDAVGGAYLNRFEVGADESVAPLAFPDAWFAVRDLLLVGVPEAEWDRNPGPAPE